jgi:hypothetical protein
MMPVADKVELAQGTAPRTIRLHDGDALYYFRDLKTFAEFVSTLADAEVPVNKMWIDTVQMSDHCWDRLPNIDASKI